MKVDELELQALVEGGSISYGIVQPGTDGELGVPIVRVGDLEHGSLAGVEPKMRVDPAIEARFHKTRLRGGEVLVSLVGAAGRTAVVPSTLAGWNVARAVAVLRPVGVEPMWLAYALAGPSCQRQIFAALNTTVQATLNLSDLKKVRVPMPASASRRAIAEVLGALDDKIAANQRVADSAVALADQLFARDKSSATLEVRAFDQVCTIAGGATPSTKVSDYWDGGIPWATPTDVTGLRAPYLDATARSITDEGLAKCSSALYPVGSILMTSRATIGAFALAKVPVAVNQGFIVAHAREPQAQLWLFHEMRSRVEDFLLYANGATFLELSKSRFKSIEVSWPADLPSVRQFCGEVAPLHDRAHQAMVESAQLAELRDTLLPHLMSGRLTVREAEKHVEAAL